MIRAPLAAIALIGLAACAGPGGAGAQEIAVDDDIFYVRTDGSSVVVRNFSTGVMNQTRLFAHARQAVTQATGCAPVDFRQEPGVNTYTGTLTC